MQIIRLAQLGNSEIQSDRNFSVIKQNDLKQTVGKTKS